MCACTGFCVCHKPHTPESLAELLLRIRERLNNDSHVKTTAMEYRDAGDELILKADGLSEAHDCSGDAVLFHDARVPGSRGEPHVAD